MPFGERQPLILPSNVEAEQGLLGAILVDNRAYERVAEFLLPEHFFEPAHGRIYEAAAKLIGAGRVANGVSLKGIVEARYLAGLAESVVSLVNAADYGRTIFDCWRRRQIVAIAEEMVEGACSPNVETPAETVVTTAEEGLYALAERGTSGGPVPAAQAIKEHVADVAEAYKAGGRITGLATGLHDLDRLLGGLKAGRLHILAGRPSMGKSLTGGVIAHNVARRGQRVAIFSLEQTRKLWTARWIARLTGIPTDQQDRGELSENEWGRLMAASDDIAKLPVLIDERGSISAAYVRQACRRLMRQGGLSLVVIDHLQKMRQGGRQENRRLEIGDTTNALASLAKELPVPVLLLSQLSRAVEQRDDKRPTLADLRESGDIEQDADVVIFAFRRAYYLEREAPTRKASTSDAAYSAAQADHAVALEECRNLMDLIVAKNRGGPVASLPFFFDGARSIVSDLHKGAP